MAGKFQLHELTLTVNKTDLEAKLHKQAMLQLTNISQETN